MDQAPANTRRADATGSTPGLRRPRLELQRALAFAFLLVVWSSASCARTELGLLPPEASENARAYARECDDGRADSCFALALIYELGEQTRQGVPANADHASALRARACAAGFDRACSATPAPSNPTEAPSGGSGSP